MSLRLIIHDPQTINLEGADKEFFGKKRRERIAMLVTGTAPHNLQRRFADSPGLRNTESQARQVSELAALGNKVDSIAKVLHIDPKVLEWVYEDDILTSVTAVNSRVAAKALELALSGTEPDMTKFWLKTRAGFKETQGLEVSGPEGGPIPTENVRERLLRKAATPEAQPAQADGGA